MGDMKTSMYGYGGKQVSIIQATAQIRNIINVASEKMKVGFNWMHATWYPDGTTKLGWHADKDPQIAKCSTIAGLSLFQNPSDVRSVEFKLQTSRKRKHREVLYYFDSVTVIFFIIYHMCVGC
jgi:hypothetical protein